MAHPFSRAKWFSRPFWMTLCQWLWRGLCFFWITLVGGLLVNLLSTRLTSSANFAPDTPIGWIVQHPFAVVSISSGLFLLTLVVGFVNAQSLSHRVREALLTPQKREILVRLFRREYRRRLSHSLQGTPLMTLRLHERTDVTRSSVQEVYRRTTMRKEYELPFGTTITQAYDDAGGGLLLLGEPGAGKTSLPDIFLNHAENIIIGIDLLL